MSRKLYVVWALTAAVCLLSAVLGPPDAYAAEKPGGMTPSQDGQQVFAVVVGLDGPDGVAGVRGGDDAKGVWRNLSKLPYWADEGSTLVLLSTDLTTTVSTGTQLIDAIGDGLSIAEDFAQNPERSSNALFIFYYSGHGAFDAVSTGPELETKYQYSGGEFPASGHEYLYRRRGDVVSDNQLADFFHTYEYTPPEPPPGEPGEPMPPPGEPIYPGDPLPPDDFIGETLSQSMAKADLHPAWEGINMLFVLDSCYSYGFWGDEDNPTTETDESDLRRLAPQVALIAADDEEGGLAMQNFETKRGLMSQGFQDAFRKEIIDDDLSTVRADFDHNGNLTFDEVLSFIDPNTTPLLHRLPQEGDPIVFRPQPYAPFFKGTYKASDWNVAGERAMDFMFNVDTNMTTDTRDIIDITHDFYTIALGRKPTYEEEDSWEEGYFLYAKDFDIDVRFVVRELARTFFLSDEYAERERTDKEFILDCYRAFFQREPSQEELDGWLAGEWSRPEAITLFAESDEFNDDIRAVYPEIQGTPERNFVTWMYIGLLDRLVDSGGLEYFVEYVDGHFDTHQDFAIWLCRQVVTSKEFLLKRPQPADYVMRFYRAFMGRFPTNSELNYWKNELESGRITVDAMLLEFAKSEEYAQRIQEFFPL